MPPDLAVMNAANLCPASRPVVETLTRETRSVDFDPSPENRARLMPEKEQTRTTLAEFLRATPDEIIITRNTSESNNLVSNGLDLKAGDEVIVHADNHPSNLNAWREKAKRFGFTVVTVEQKNPHPGMAYYVDAFAQGDHAAHESPHLHAPVEHRRRSDAGQGAVRAGPASAACCRCSTAPRASGCSTSTWPTSSRTSTAAARTSGRAAPASAACCSSTSAPRTSSGPRSTARIRARSASRARSKASGSATKRR